MTRNRSARIGELWARWRRERPVQQLPALMTDDADLFLKTNFITTGLLSDRTEF